MSDAADTFRWQAFFQHSTQPLFLLNRRRRLLFVNRAWEACTGLTHAEVRGRACRRRAAPVEDADEAILRACAPPAEVLRGETCRVRRRRPGGMDWWDIQFVPLAGSGELLGILGMIRVLAAPKEPPFALPEQLMALRDQQATRYRLEDLDTSHPAMRRLVAQAHLASQTRVPITIVGEAGAGKEWLARAIHLASADRASYFMALDCERLPADLLETVLFGPRSQALAPGTVYLREPTCLPREWQGRLGEVALSGDAHLPHIVLGMRRFPREEVRVGRLLEELRCAAGTLTLTVPPLRERPEEVPGFIERFLHRLHAFEPHGVSGVSAEALATLRSHAWPANLRELLAVLRGACRRARGDRIEVGDLPFHLRHRPLPPERRLPLDTLLEQVERRLIGLAMKLADGNHTRAAELLEIWRPRLLRRLEKFEQDEQPG